MLFCGGRFGVGMVSGRPAGELNMKRLWLVALVLVAMPLAVEFNSRLAVSRQLFEEEARLQREIEREQARRASLKTFEAFARSDAYVEWWARTQARMVKPGEVAVVPQTPADAAQPGAVRGAGRVVRDIPGEWWAAFFGSIP